MKAVRAAKDLGIVRGATGPHVFGCEDGRKYLVKFAGPSSKAAVNELVGHSLAKAVGLPVPEAALVEVPSDLVASSREMVQREIQSGVHFGSELIEDHLDIDQFSLEEQRGATLTNPDVLPRTMCIDNWILVPDRNRGDNHLVEREDGRFAYVMVDFSHGFTGPAWTADAIEQGSYVRELMPTHPSVARAVVNPDSFQPTLGQMETLEDAEIERIVSSIPASWGLTEDEVDCLERFLDVRRKMVRNVLVSQRTRFPNWVD